jgi:hypothetical protein
MRLHTKFDFLYKQFDKCIKSLDYHNSENINKIHERTIHRAETFPGTAALHIPMILYD